MVDSRAKGARGEYKVRDTLREATGLLFERVPSSGALSYLKGDLYVPHEDNIFCIEVKNYEEPILDIKVFTNKSSYFTKFWDKTCSDAALRNQKPLLIFKHNRSKVYVATEEFPGNTEKYMYISWLNCYVMLLDEWLEEEEIQWLKPSQNT